LLRSRHPIAEVLVRTVRISKAREIVIIIQSPIRVIWIPPFTAITLIILYFLRASMSRDMDYCEAKALGVTLTSSRLHVVIHIILIIRPSRRGRRGRT